MDYNQSQNDYNSTIFCCSIVYIYIYVCILLIEIDVYTQKSKIYFEYLPIFLIEVCILITYILNNCFTISEIKKNNKNTHYSNKLLNND